MRSSRTKIKQNGSSSRAQRRSSRQSSRLGNIRIVEDVGELSKVVEEETVNENITPVGKVLEVAAVGKGETE